MKKILFLFLLFCTYAFSQILLPDDLKPGMKGYGLTVFKGQKIQKFNVEILGVLKNTRVKGDLILAKLSGGPLAETGVIAGMSGSPVYVSNKIIGAVAFSWSFAKEPIAGITPIHDMLSLFNQSLPTNSFKGIPNYLNNESENNSSIKIQNFQNQNFVLKRISTPMVVTGVDEKLINVLSLKFNDTEFLPIQGGSTAFESNLQTNFEPGSAIAIRLVTGDLNISGIGTVTYKKGNKLLIFGHPMFQRGYFHYPIAPANIITIFPGYQLSFKIGSAGPIVGQTVQDRQYAVSCEVGPKPTMLPVHITQNYGDNVYTYSYKIINDYLYTQRFLTTCIVSAITHDKSPREKNSFYISAKISLNDGKQLILSNLYSELTTLINVYDAISDLTMPIQKLILNPFKSVEITNIDITIQQSDKIHIAEIKNFKLLNRGKIYPGDTLNMKIFLQPYQKSIITTNIQIKLPASIKPGMLTLFLSSAKEEKMTDTFFAPDRFNPQTYDQLLNFFQDQDRNNEFVLWGLAKSPGLYIKGEKFPDLPQSKFKILQQSNEDSESVMAVKFKKKITTPYVLYNYKKLNIKISKNTFGR